MKTTRKSMIFIAVILIVVLPSIAGAQEDIIQGVSPSSASPGVTGATDGLNEAVRILQALSGISHGDGLGYRDTTGDGVAGIADVLYILQTEADLRDTGSERVFQVADTDQVTCYDDAGTIIVCPSPGASFHGQDAQYAGAATDYTDNGDGTVTDNNTGLMWQQDPGDKMYHADAVAGASSFNLAGYSDWRLPTIKELYSLIRFNGTDPSGLPGDDTSGLTPFIDSSHFAFQYGDPSVSERIIDSQWATSTIYTSTTMGGSTTMFGVNFADGRIKGYPRDNKTYFVIYVRGNTAYGTNDFADNGDGTITDSATGLMWQQGDSGPHNWEDALTYCESLQLAGRNDWRLPNAKELQSIVDYSRSPDTTGSPAIDPLFDVTSITNEGGQTDYPFYWTGTTHANFTNFPGGSAAYVAFGRALGYMNGQWTDVHGAGAQRSDPKTGDPNDYPTGHGPQGDAIRIYNYARCVCDAQ